MPVWRDFALSLPEPVVCSRWRPTRLRADPGQGGTSAACRAARRRNGSTPFPEAGIRSCGGKALQRVSAVAAGRTARRGERVSPPALLWPAGVDGTLLHTPTVRAICAISRDGDSRRHRGHGARGQSQVHAGRDNAVALSPPDCRAGYESALGAWPPPAARRAGSPATGPCLLRARGRTKAPAFGTPADFLAGNHRARRPHHAAPAGDQR